VIFSLKLLDEDLSDSPVAGSSKYLRLDST
jgi:hypothetical protein